MEISKLVLIYVLLLLQLGHTEISRELFEKLGHEANYLPWNEKLSEKTRKKIHKSVTGETDYRNEALQKIQKINLKHSLKSGPTQAHERILNLEVPLKPTMILVPESITKIALPPITRSTTEPQQSSSPDSGSTSTTASPPIATPDLGSTLITQSLQTSSADSGSTTTTVLPPTSRSTTEPQQSSSPDSGSTSTTVSSTISTPDSASTLTTESPKTTKPDSGAIFWNPLTILLVAVGGSVLLSIVVVSSYHIGKIRTKDKIGYPPHESEPPKIIPRVRRGVRNPLPYV